jgi:ribosomal silencing factor RsfS
MQKTNTDYTKMQIKQNKNTELEWVSEWLLFNANAVIVQLYHGENRLNFQWDDDEVFALY